MIDLVHLRSFVEVATRGTVAAAAAAQGYTAPAVSQHVAKLEAALGTRLFDRVGGRLSLTAAGSGLLPVAHEMLDLDAQARAAVAAPAARPHVVIAGFASAISTVVVPKLDALRLQATIEIVEAEDLDALRDLGLGAVDIVLTQEYTGSPVERHARVDHTPLGRDRLTLVLPPDLPASTTVADLADAPWLLNGRGTRCALATTGVLRAAGIAPRVVATVADNTALLSLVAAGHGVTMVPARVLQDGEAQVTVADQDLGVWRTIHAVSRSVTTVALAPVVDLLRSPLG